MWSESGFRREGRRTSKQVLEEEVVGTTPSQQPPLRPQHQTKYPQGLTCRLALWESASLRNGDWIHVGQFSDSTTANPAALP
jgi:hypothetical protein